MDSLPWKVIYCPLTLAFTILKNSSALMFLPFAPLSLHEFPHYYGFCWLLYNGFAITVRSSSPTPVLYRPPTVNSYFFPRNWHNLLPLFYVQLLGFAVHSPLTHKVSLILCSCAFIHGFVAGFLQICPHKQHPCHWLTFPIGRHVRNLHPKEVWYA